MNVGDKFGVFVVLEHSGRSGNRADKWVRVRCGVCGNVFGTKARNLPHVVEHPERVRCYTCYYRKSGGGR